MHVLRGNKYLIRAYEEIWYVKSELLKTIQIQYIFCLIKSSRIEFIFLPAFCLIMWLMTTQNNFEKIAVLKI